MVVENAFGKLKRRWRCLLKRMDYYSIEYTTDVVAACIVLHNICELNNDTCNPEWIHVDESSHDTRSPADVSQHTTESAFFKHLAI